jgi:hypothetical protein
VGRFIATAVAWFVWMHASEARAQDPFEIQVYDSETAAPLSSGLELHTNYVAVGGGPVGLALATDHVLHVTFEPHLGLGDWAEVGGYLQTALRPDGGFDYAGVKARFKARWPHRLRGGVIGLALNSELSAIPRDYSYARFGAELRPIADLWLPHLYASVNPILDFDLEGGLAGRPQFEPAAKVAWLLRGGTVGIGAEYYAAFGSFTAPLGLSRQTHRLFAALDFLDITLGKLRAGANMGAGYNFGAGDRWIVKAILGVDFGAGPRPPRS